MFISKLKCKWSFGTVLFETVVGFHFSVQDSDRMLSSLLRASAQSSSSRHLNTKGMTASSFV